MGPPDYNAGEVLLAAEVRAATGYSAANVSQADWSIFNKQGITTGAVIWQAPSTLTHGAGRTDGHWAANVEIRHKYDKDTNTYANLKSDVKNIIARLDLYPHMQDTTGTITDAKVIALGAILQMPPDGPKWLGQILTVTWIEEQPVTILE